MWAIICETEWREYILHSKIRRWEGGREWGNRWMLACPGPWRLGVAVALRSRSPQTAAKLARSGSIRFYSIPWPCVRNVREWGNRWMLASPGPWRLGVAVATDSYLISSQGVV